MKKILLLLLCIVILVSCNRGMKDSYSAYRGMTAHDLYERASASLKKGNYSDAVKYLEASDAIYPFGPYAEPVGVDSIYAYYKKGDDEMALASAERYLRVYPRGDYADYALYMKGLINYEHGFTWLQKKFRTDPAPRDLSDKRVAFGAFSQLASYYPNSPYTPSALWYMATIRNLMARKDVIIADYYYRRKAYVAAANRASDVVRHFEGSPQVIPALQIMVKSYRALGLTEMAASTEHILVANYGARAG